MDYQRMSRSELQDLCRINKISPRNAKTSKLAHELERQLSIQNSPIVFSWRHPHHYRNQIPGGGWETVDTPLPLPLDQSRKTSTQNSCIPHSIHAVMTAQSNILAQRMEKEPPPPLSLNHLIALLRSLPRDKQCLQEVLMLVRKDGILSHKDFKKGIKDADGKIMGNRYFVDYNVDDDIDGEDADNYEKIQTSLCEYPLIAEFVVNDDFDGPRNVLYDPRSKPADKDSMEVTEGHAVCLTGWGRSVTNQTTEIWEFLNSYGYNFGRNGGYGEVVRDGLFYVYRATMRQWW